MPSSFSNERWRAARFADASASMPEGSVSESSGFVYVVDGDVLIRQALVNLLDALGLGVEAFADAHLFLDAQRRDAAHLILDVGLPRSSEPSR